MPEIRLMQPHAGHWMLPLLRCVGCAESERRDVVGLVFAAREELDGEVKDLTIRIPVPIGDAGALLDRLLHLRETGVLPEAGAAPEPFGQPAPEPAGA